MIKITCENCGHFIGRATDDNSVLYMAGDMHRPHYEPMEGYCVKCFQLVNWSPNTESIALPVTDITNTETVDIVVAPAEIGKRQPPRVKPNDKPKKRKVYNRDVTTGKFITKEQVTKSPETTVTEKR